MAVPSNLYDSVVLNSPVVGDLTWTNNDYRLLRCAGLGTPIDLEKILSYQHTAFTAGTAQVNTLDFAATVFVAGTPSTIVIMRNDTNEKRTYTITPTVATTTTNRSLFVTQIQADPFRIVDAAAGGGSTMTLTQLVDTGGFTVLQFPALATNTATTAYVAASGTYAEVVQYDANALAGGQFDKWSMLYEYKQQNSMSTNFGTGHGLIVIWGEVNAAGYAAFAAEILQTVTASDTAAENQPYDRVVIS